MSKNLVLVTFYESGGGSELLFHRLGKYALCETVSLANSGRNVFREIYFMFIVIPKKILSYEGDVIFMSSHYILHLLIAIYSRFDFKKRKCIYRISSDFHKRWPKYKLALYLFSLKFFKRGDDLIVVQSLQAQLELEKYFGSAIRYIPNPIFDEFGADVPEEEPNFKEYVLCAGRLLELKGFQDVIVALKEVNTNLIIVGQGTFKKKLIELRDSLGLTSKVMFIGWSENLKMFIQNASVCVVSSYVEGWPNVLNEMIAFNGNVVCSRFNKDVDRLKTRNYNPGDVSHLAELIREALSEPLSKSDHKEYIEERSVGKFLEALGLE